MTIGTAGARRRFEEVVVSEHGEIHGSYCPRHRIRHIRNKRDNGLCDHLATDSRREGDNAGTAEIDVYSGSSFGYCLRAYALVTRAPRRREDAAGDDRTGVTATGPRDSRGGAGSAGPNLDVLRTSGLVRTERQDVVALHKPGKIGLARNPRS